MTQRLICRVQTQRNTHGGWLVTIMRSGKVVHSKTMVGVSNIAAFLRVTGEYLAELSVEPDELQLTLKDDDKTIIYVWREK